MSITGESHFDTLEEINKRDQKKKFFDKEFRALFKQSQETIFAKYGASMEYGNIRQESVCLNKYLAVYNNMDPTEHYRYFETLFGQKRREILNTIQDNSWTKGSKIVIQFGQGSSVSKELEQKRKQVRIMLSDIFTIAYELQSDAEQNIEELGKEFTDGSRDLIRPNILILHLMRIFYHLNDGSDKEQLGKIVTHFENELGVSKKSVGEDRKSLPIETGGLSGLFSMATNVMKRMGFETPAGMEAPSESDISNVITSVFNHEGTQSVIQGMFSSLKGCNDIQGAIEAVVKSVSDPETMRNIQGTVEKGFGETQEVRTHHSE